jgi:hypothetical protein
MIDVLDTILSTDELCCVVMTHLQDKEPLSVIRIGDGEMVIANNMVERLNKFCIKQIGRVITSEELKYAQDNIVKAITRCDVIGIPTNNHIIKHPLWASILPYYNYLKDNNKNWNEKIYCSIDSHLHLLQTKQIFNILQTVNKIVIVSSRDIGEKLMKKFPNITEVEYYPLPPEQVYEINKNTEMNIFEILEDITSKLYSKDRSGELLIYGAGPFGKHIGIDFSNRGGVSLDLGSVFDLFVGKITRGKVKGVDSFTTPYL